jgi:hypothetical protein
MAARRSTQASHSLPRHRGRRRVRRVTLAREPASGQLLIHPSQVPIANRIRSVGGRDREARRIVRRSKRAGKGVRRRAARRQPDRPRWRSGREPFFASGPYARQRAASVSARTSPSKLPRRVLRCEEDLVRDLAGSGPSARRSRQRQGLAQVHRTCRGGLDAPGRCSKPWDRRTIVTVPFEVYPLP